MKEKIKVLFKVIPDLALFNKLIVSIKFRLRQGYWIDFSNLLSLNEKAQWIKLFDRNDLYTTVADKYAVREFVKSRIGEKHLIPLITYGEDVDNLINNLPENTPYIIKTNHDCSGGLILRNIAEPLLDVKSHGSYRIAPSEFLNVTEYNKKYINKFLTDNLKNNYFWSSREWQYKNIPGKYIVEKLLTDCNGNIPNDYKFHCIDGEVCFIYVSADREGKNYRKIYYPDWTEAPFTWTSKGKEGKFSGPQVPKPDCLDRMLEIAKKLSDGFKYVRVDLYSCEDQIYFGELTLQHGSGFEPILPNKYDLHYGSLIKIK